MRYMKYLLLFAFIALPALFLSWFFGMFSLSLTYYEVSADIKADYSGAMKTQVFYVIDGINQGYSQQHSITTNLKLDKGKFSHLSVGLNHADRKLEMLRLDLGDKPSGIVTVRDLKVEGYGAASIRNASGLAFHDLKLIPNASSGTEAVFEVTGYDPYISYKDPLAGSSGTSSPVRSAWIAVCLKILTVLFVSGLICAAIGRCYFVSVSRNAAEQNMKCKLRLASMALQFVLIYYWLNFWLASDSYYSVYLICGIFGIFSVYKSRPSEYCTWKVVFIGFMSVLFSLGVILANWRLFSEPDTRTQGALSDLFPLLNYMALFLAGVSVSYNSLMYIAKGMLDFRWKPEKRTGRQVAIFALCCIAVFCIIDISTLFLYNYPGTLTNDSVYQIAQISQNTYNNHHPFWYTMIIKIFITIGQNVFHDITAAVALYSVFQIILMALCFTYALTTAYEAGIPAAAAALCLFFCALMPYNILYSFIMWKDILFGGMVLVFIVSVYRIIYGIGNSRFNIVSLFWGGIGTCLFRSNGLFAFAVSLIVFALLFRLKYFRVICLFIGIIVISVIMKYPVLKALNVPQPDFVESLSIPLQQIARVVADGKEITAEQKALLGRVADLAAVQKTYTNWLSDPMKKMVRRSGNQNYLVEHKADYFKVWLSIGLRYPGEYLKAWIDQTRGFWHGGYTRLPCEMGVNANYVGVRPNVKSTWAACARFRYFAAFTDSKYPALKPFLSIGFYFWILMALFCCNVINNRKAEIFLAVPAIAVTMSLFIATPLYNEFRYVYAVSSCLPFVLLFSLYFLNRKHNSERIGEDHP